MPRHLTRRTGLFIVPAWLGCWRSGVAKSAEQGALRPEFYRATAIVTGTDMRQRPLGFERCLIEVLVKLTGRPGLRDDPNVKALAHHADTLVDSFTYVDPRAALLHHDDQGTYDRSQELTVRFKPEAVDAALATLGIPLWRGKRPLLTPVLLVRNRDPTPFLLSVETPRGVDMRSSIVRIASSFGIGTHFPSESELDAWGIDTIGFPAPLAAPGLDQLLVIGTLSFNVKEMGWTGEFHTELNGAVRDDNVHGVSYDQAFDVMVSAAVTLASG